MQNCSPIPSTIHTQKTLFAVAAALIVSFGHENPRDFCAGTDESDWLIFTTKQGQDYSLEYDDVDYDFTVAAYRGDAIRYWETFSKEDEEGDEPDDYELHDCWKLRLQSDHPHVQDPEEIDMEAVSLDHGDYDHEVVRMVFAIGALTAFLHDIREGKVG